MNNDLQERENWTSKLGFILAAAGSAVGLGNIWRFPYVTGENGGAAFLLIYLIAIILIGYPVMVAEMSLGRKTEKNPVGAFKNLAPDTPWWLVGALGVFTGFVILSYYSVIAGWSMAYIVQAANGFTSEMDFAGLFGGHISSVGEPLLWHATFMGITIGIISAGVVKGIQKAVKILMPILFILLVALVFRSVSLEGAGEGLAFYLAPDFSQLTWYSLNEAIAQAFFTLSLGMGAMITYGSYLSKDDNISDSAGYVLGLDTLIAVLSGFAIFPAVFALGLSPDAGPGLTFITLPAVFAEMPLGTLFGFLFFVLLTIAAITSAISLLEVVVAYMVDEHEWERKKAAQVVGIVIFLVGIPPLLGYSALSDFQFLGMDILDTYDWFANAIFLPLGGLLTAIFAGYVWGARNTADEANKAEGVLSVGNLFGVLIKYVVPVAIGTIMVVGIWQTLAG
ncbi:sodium-dependent transporter [Natroniella sp. ANB-PHB2]|uniref:sodium-dependent transporter n=1 Tax=Natroniella sp. ANB-PHB2 TaxID=3384444 RepID=UPI0038D44A83